MTLQYVSVYAVIDDEDQAGLARTIETMSRNVAALTLDGYVSGITVKPWEDDEDIDVDVDADTT